jgi:nitroreductase/NAD-dependent dihydropyrimidine dehydrogenase PreA subunit
MSSIVVDVNMCLACGACVKACPCAIFGQSSYGEKAAVRAENAAQCIRCGHCVAACPVDAVSCHGLKAMRFDKRMKPDADALKVLLCSRRSIRNFKKQTMTQEQVKRLLDLAVYAPTAKNTQTIRWAVVLDPDKVKKLSALAVDWMRYMVEQNHPMAEMFRFADRVAGWEKGIDPVLRTAPHLVMAYSHKDDIFGQGSGYLCAEYLELAAHGLGFGTCWAGFFDIAFKSWEPLRAAVGLPADHVLHASLMLGIPDEQYVAFPPRNPPEVTWV